MEFSKTNYVHNTVLDSEWNEWCVLVSLWRVLFVLIFVQFVYKISTVKIVPIISG